MNFFNTRYFFLLLLPLIPSAGGAQQIFEKELQFDRACMGFHLIEISGGGFFIGGNTRNENDITPFVCKTTADGSPEWSRLIDSSMSAGVVSSVIESPDGGLIAAGFGESGSTNQQFFIEKFDLQGNVRWSHFLGSRTWDLLDEAIAPTSDSGFIAAASYHAAEELVVWKLRSDGTTEWMKIFKNKIDQNQASPIGITELADGSYIIGTSDYQTVTGGIKTIKLSAKGDLLWQSNILVSKTLRRVLGRQLIRMSDGGFAVCGTIDNIDNFNGGVPEVFAARMDANGNILWEESIDVFGPATAESIAEGANGDLFIAGAVSYTSRIPLGAFPSDSLLLLRLHGNGDFVSAQYLGLPHQNSIAYSIIRTADHDFMVCGAIGSKETDGYIWGGLLLMKTDSMLSGCHFGSTLVSIRSECVSDRAAYAQSSDIPEYRDTLHPASFGDATVTDLCTLDVNSNETAVTNRGISVYPNPFTSEKQLTVSIRGLPGIYDLSLLDLAGNIIKNQPVMLFGNWQGIPFEIPDCAAGVYIIELQSGHDPAVSYRAKFVKQ